MPYTLLTTATLGFDLARRRTGPLVANIVATALTADVSLLNRLAAAHPGADPAADAQAVGAPYAVTARRAREAAASSHSLRQLVPSADHPGAPGLRQALTDDPIGDVHALERLLLTEVLGPDHAQAAATEAPTRRAATDVLVNAAIAAWGAHVFPSEAVEQMLRPYRQALAGSRPRLPDFAPGQGAVVAVLTAPLNRAAVIAKRWAATAAEPRPPGWAAAVHEACWATHLSGRIRTVAAAHLLGVQTFGSAALCPAHERGTLWNLFAGALQATAVADLLDERSSQLLITPWQRLCQ